MVSLGLKEKRLSLYSWKHTGAACFYESTKDILSLMGHCRHNSITITQRYMASLNIGHNPVVSGQYPTL
ncbi:MAG: hypothetical protein OHK0053_14540 [Microscillaceae bacterium]